MELKAEYRKEIKLKDGIKYMTFEECNKQFENFIYSIANRYKSTMSNYGLRSEELHELCLVGFWKAYKSYELSKNTMFITYCARCMTNEVNMYLRKCRNRHQEISIYEPIIIGDDGSEIYMNDTLYSQLNIENEILLKIEIAQYYKRLLPREKYILDQISLNKTQHEIAATLNMSQSYISRIIKNLRKNLLKQLNS